MGKLNLKTKKVHVGLGLLVIGLMVFSAGCDILLPPGPLEPTATPTQTLTPTPTIDWFPATPTPTFIPEPSPTPQPTLAGSPDGVTELRVRDDFTDQTLWNTPISTSGNVAYGNESLTLAPALKGVYLFSLSQHTISSQFYLELTVQTTLCQANDQYGVVFWRQAEGDYYRLLLNCAGQVRLELVQGGVLVVVHDWESASRIQPGAPATNRIGLYASGGVFQLYINDTFQFEEKVANGRSGDLGFFARTVTSSVMTVRISELEIYRVSEE
jgi:hypothetical protein